MTLTVMLLPLALVVVALAMALGTAVRQRRARVRAAVAGVVPGSPAPAARDGDGRRCTRDGESVVVLGADGRAYDARLTGLRASQLGSQPLLHELGSHAATASDGASSDEIMAIPDRRRFLDLVRRELIRSSRYGRPLSLLAMRLDRFDAVVERHGHEVADAVLRAVAATVVADLRATDSLGRLGDDAFGVCLPETEAAQAVAVAERVVAEVRAVEVPAGGVVVAVTASVATSSVAPGDLHDLELLLARAVSALERARLAGGDRVCAGQVRDVGQGPPSSGRGG